MFVTEEASFVFKFVNYPGYRVGKFGRGGTDDELEKPLNPV
jgi:hypothetical protein